MRFGEITTVHSVESTLNVRVRSICTWLLKIYTYAWRFVWWIWSFMFGNFKCVRVYTLLGKVYAHHRFVYTYSRE